MPSAASTLKAYTKCTPVNYGLNGWIKTIAQPKHVMAFVSPHFPEYKEGYYAVSVDLKRVRNSRKGHLICCQQKGLTVELCYQQFLHAQDNVNSTVPYLSINSVSVASVLDNCTQVERDRNDEPNYEKIVLNHYFTKSWTEWIGKIRRGNADGFPKWFQDFQGVQQHAVEDCPYL